MTFKIYYLEWSIKAYVGIQTVFFKKEENSQVLKRTKSFEPKGHRSSAKEEELRIIVKRPNLRLDQPAALPFSHTFRSNKLDVDLLYESGM